jgi:hypothetical protein
MRVGIAHHFGWAIAVTATADHRVVDRRRIDLVGPDLPAAPVHHVGGPWDTHRTGDPLGNDALAALVAEVWASAVATTAAALDELTFDVGGRITSISLRAWPEDFPTDIALLRQVPYEAQADSVMYRQVLAELAAARGWRAHRFTARDVEAEATRVLGERAAEILQGPRATLGPPWTKDHRMALAATVVVN